MGTPRLCAGTGGYWSLSLLRVILGWWLFVEGSEKLFGWFGGGGLDLTRQFYDRLNVPFSPHHALIVASTETVCGILLTAGFLTRLAALPVAALTAGALYLIGSLGGGLHFGHVVVLGASLLLVEAGGGPVSADACIFRSSVRTTA